MQKHTKKVQYKTYCYDYQSNLLFFYYNSEHPVMVKNVKFQFGRVRIFTNQNKIYTCQLFSSPHLNGMVDWNQQYFMKLFKGLNKFELEKNNDEHDNTVELIVRDYDEQEEIYLLRAKLNEQFGHDSMNQLWNTFSRYNNEKVKNIENSTTKNEQFRQEADEELVKLIAFQESKEKQLDKLKGQLSALLREKEAKLRMFNENFDYFSFCQQSDPSVDLADPRYSITGSLFQESQEFGFPN